MFIHPVQNDVIAAKWGPTTEAAVTEDKAKLAAAHDDTAADRIGLANRLRPREAQLGFPLLLSVSTVHRKE